MISRYHVQDSIDSDINSETFAGLPFVLDGAIGKC